MSFATRCALAALFTLPAFGALAQNGKAGPRMDCVPFSLRSVLSEVEQKFGPVTLLSTYRPHAVVAGTGHPSLHRECRAVDFRVSGRRRPVIAFLRNDPRVLGLGIYRDGHIHIDNGPRRATWNN